jgi:hypothetical protein
MLAEARELALPQAVLLGMIGALDPEIIDLTLQ